jgi:predicted MFS family arabinose efflux permease
MSPAIEDLVAAPTAAGPRPRIVTRPLLMVYLSGFSAMTSFYLLLSVVPAYAASVGGGRTGAGFATGALMASTVAAELLTPRLIARFGYRTTRAAGLLLVGAPALALPAATGMAAITAVCLVRGVGLAIIMVVGHALMATLVPRERRGEGLGLAGLVLGVPAVVALPLGVWVAGHFGYTVVFVAGAAAALAGLAAAPGLPRFPGDHPHGEDGEHGEHRDGGRARQAEPLGVVAGLRTPAMLRPALAFATSAMTAGVVVTFLPIIAGASSGGVVAVALLVQASTSTLTRWWAGRHGDRHGPGRLLAPGLLVAAAGMLVLVAATGPVAVVAAMALFGTGFGVAQTASLSVMFAVVPASGYGTASALWNLAYDAGLGIGGAGFGLVAARTGYQAGFAVTSALMLLALVLTRRRLGGIGAPQPRPHPAD